MRNPPRTPRLPQGPSDRLCRLVGNCLREAGRRETDLAAAVRPAISPATLNRLLSTDQHPTVAQAQILVRRVADMAGLLPNHIWRVLEGELDPCLGRELELATVNCVRADDEEIQEIADTLEAAEQGARHSLSYRRVLPGFLLEDEVADNVLAFRARQLASDSKKAYQLLRGVTDERREAFMNGHRLGGVRNITVSIPLSGLLRMMRLRPPFAACSSEQMDATFESILFDAVSERGVIIATINDLVRGPGRNWVRKQAEFASATLLDSGLLIKRRRGTLACRILRAGSDPASRWLLDHHRAQLAEAPKYACHGLAREEVFQFLKEFLEANGRPPRGRPGSN